MEELIEFLMSKYEIEEDAARELALTGLGMVSTGLQTAGQPSEQLAALKPNSSDLVTEEDVLSSLVPYVKTIATSKTFKISPLQGYKLPACGDGSCLFTSLRVAIDLKASFNFAYGLLQEGKTQDDTDMHPDVCGARGSANHQDNYKLRKLLVSWYCNPRTNLDLEMPLEYGDVVYEEDSTDLDEHGKPKKVLKHRPMTRCDIIVMETMYSSKRDVGMSNSEDHKLIRRNIAMAYLERMIRDCEWGSVPLIVAFAHLWTPSIPVRIYQILNGKLVKYQDILPIGTSLPSEEDDDMLAMTTQMQMSSCAANFSDLDLYSEAEASEAASETASEIQEEHGEIQEEHRETEGETSETQAETSDAEHESDAETASISNAEETKGEPSATAVLPNILTPTIPEAEATSQNFIRLLFDRDGPGHYDALATVTQRNVICSIFPACEADFYAL